MINKITLSKILFLDIETVPESENFNDLSDIMKSQWQKKSKYISNENNNSIEYIYNQNAGIYAEFGKIICISVGFVNETITGKQIKIKSFYHKDEYTILKQFIALLNNYRNTEQVILCGHNAKEFDFPYIARRILIQGLELPFILNIAGKKPWEIQHLDTMELWKFGDYKKYTSLELLAEIFKIPTPKDKINGNMVRDIYYKDEKIDDIVEYCNKDVVTLIQIFLRFRGEKLISDSEIKIIN